MKKLFVYEELLDEAAIALRVLNASSNIDTKMMTKAIDDCLHARLKLPEMMAVYAYRKGCHIRQRDREIYQRKSKKAKKLALKVIEGGRKNG